MVGVMITQGNNFHPADYHAEVTASKIVVVAETASSETKSAGRDLLKKIEKVLVAHHQKVEDAEQEHLSAKGGAHYSDTPDEHQYDASDYIDDETLQEIVNASRGTILESHFAREDVQRVITDILHHETRTQMRVHALVHQTGEKLKAQGKQ